METIQNRSESGTLIHIDNKFFLSCQFTRCELIYTGGDFAWRNTSFVECKLTFDGPAGRTVNFLRAFNLLKEQLAGEAAPPAVPHTGTVH
ncbi:MAG TPA: hypothetical protein VK473_15350 [Terriglobales bacterium]|nr:hypothetical protein [Terriglobales bacterium]